MAARRPTPRLCSRSTCDEATACGGTGTRKDREHPAAGAPQGRPPSGERRRHRAAPGAGAGAWKEERPIPGGMDNRGAARGADVIIIAVKPQNVRELLEEIRAEVTPAQLVISV